MLKRAMIIGLTVVFLGLTGCAELGQLRKQNANLRDQVTSLQADRDQLLARDRALQTDRDSLRAALDSASKESQRMAALLERLRAEEAKSKQQALDLQKLLDKVGVAVEHRPEGNFIVMESEILFEPGKDELNAGATASLDTIADYLRATPGLTSRIDGHTDGVPISHSAWKDNYHLGAMRALAVMRYLVGAGLDPKRAYVVSYGPNRPAVEPEEPTAEMAENRRVEILIIPEAQRSISEILEAWGE